MEQFLKLSLGGATIDAQMAEKNLKIWENGCKVCAHHSTTSTIYKQDERKVLPQHYDMYCRCAPYKIFR